MKKILFLPFLLLCVFSSYAENTNADLLINNTEVSSELSQLSALEKYLEAHPGATLNDLKSENNQLVDANLLNSMAAGDKNPVIGIPSFLWGCGFGVVGLAIVYFVAEDQAETKKALWGCVVGTAIEAAAYFLLIAASTAATI